METARWLAELASKFNRHGADSPETLAFLETSPTYEARKLGELSIELKKALNPRKEDK